MEKENKKNVRHSIWNAVSCMLGIALLFAILAGCSQSASGDDPSDDTISATDAKDFYLKLAKQDITKNTGKLVVCNDAGVQKTIEDSQLKSTRNVSRAVNNDLGWHPMKKDLTVFYPNAEVIQMGYQNGSHWYTVWGDKDDNNYATYFDTLPGDEIYEEQAEKITTKGDFDGDGLDEAIIFYFMDLKLKYRVYDDGSFSSLKDVPSAIIQEDNESILCYCCDSGDLNGDQKDEIVLASQGNETNNHISIYTYNNKTISLLTTTTVATLENFKDETYTGKGSFFNIAVGYLGNTNDSIAYSVGNNIAIMNLEGTTITGTEAIPISYNTSANFFCINCLLWIGIKTGLEKS